MRHIKILAAIAATLMVGSAASAKEKAEKPKEKKICKYEPDSTSRLGKRVCRTKAQWENDQRDAGRTITGSGRTN